MATNDCPPDLGGAEYLRLVGLGAVIGIPAAFLAAVFLAFVRDLEHWLWDSLPSALGHASPPWYLVIGLPIAGACVVVVARLLLPGDGGHRPLEGIGGGATPVSHGPGIALAAIGTLSFGAVLGPARASEQRRMIGLVAVCGYVAVVVVNSAWLWPILTGQLITYEEWRSRIWFPSWI